MQKNTFEKKTIISYREMLIEQIIEFELMGSGPPCRACTVTAGCFYDKTRISKKNL